MIKDGFKDVDAHDIDFTSLLSVAIINLVDESGTTIQDLSVKSEDMLKLKKLLTGNKGDTAEISFEGEFHNHDKAPNWYKEATQFTPYLACDIMVESNTTQDISQIEDDSSFDVNNVYANFVKILGVYKHFSKDLVNEKGNIPRCGVVPGFSDLEVIALSITQENMGIDSECYLSGKLEEYRDRMPNLISRRQYNDRRKYTAGLCEKIRKRMAECLDGGEDIFVIDSKPVKVCQLVRGKRNQMGKTCIEKAPNFGYCVSQATYYYGYKLHAVCGVSGVIHSYNLTPASIHDVRYLADVGRDYCDCTIIGDRGYISAEIQLNLFETANIQLEVPCRCNQKEWKPLYKPFGKVRKRIETLFSQCTDQFNIMRNYAKDYIGFFTRIISKMSALTVSQYINKINGRPIGQIKYALA